MVTQLNITAFVNWMRVDSSSHAAQHSGNAGHFSICVHHFVVGQHLPFEHLQISSFPTHQYRTLQELVEHYSKDSDGLCVNLRKACVQVITLIIHLAYCELVLEFGPQRSMAFFCPSPLPLPPVSLLFTKYVFRFSFRYICSCC